VATTLRKAAASALEKERGEIYVPEGPSRAGASALPARLGGFYIEKTEVTNEAWAAALEANHLARPESFPKSGPLPPELAQKPVTGVSFEEAQAYARALGKRLPTSAEWERAARGDDSRAYPFGPHFEPGRANLQDGGSGGLEDVSARPGDVSPVGALGMAGNAIEWVVGEQGPLAAGGSFRSHPLTGRVFARFAPDAKTRHLALGFRCARDLE
jgi:formylglycine-generating enzyme required for sulfatase activity